MLTVDLKRLDLADGQSAIDIGCGRGRHTHALAARGGLHVVGLDMDPTDLGGAREGFEFYPTLGGWSLLVGDALHLPFPDDAFDRVICSEVLEHLPDFESALSEISRITKPGGVFALSVPRAWPEAICWRLSTEYSNTPGGHVRIFNARALRDAVQTHGFTPYARHGAHALHSPYWWLKCAVWDRNEDHPLVKLYKGFLEWDLVKKPLFTRALEAMLNPFLGKSIVMYFRRDDARDGVDARDGATA